MVIISNIEKTAFIDCIPVNYILVLVDLLFAGAFRFSELPKVNDIFNDPLIEN